MVKKTLFSACLERVGLTREQAAAYLNIPAYTIKKMCNGSKIVPQGVWDDLRRRQIEIVDGSEELLERWEQSRATRLTINDDEAGDPAILAAADFVLSVDAGVEIEMVSAERVAAARRARRMAGG